MKRERKRKRNLKRWLVFSGLFLLILGAVACFVLKGSSPENLLGGYLYPAYTEENGIRKWGLINENGEFEVEPAYDGMDWQAGDRWVKIYANDGQSAKVGLLDRTNGKVVLAPHNLYIGDFAEGFATVQVSEEKYEVIDEQGQVVFTTKHELMDSFSNGVVKFKKNADTLYGYMDRKGNVVMEPVYPEADNFTDGKALVTMSQGEQTLLDLKGKILQKYNFAQVGGISEGMIKYFDQDSQKWGFASLDGEKLLAPAYEYADHFFDGKAIVSVDTNAFGLIDQKGNYVLEPKYARIEFLGEGKYAVCQSGATYPLYSPMAIFDEQGKQLTDFVYYELGKYQNGSVSVCDGKETYLLDEAGQVVPDFPRIAELGRLERDGDLIKGQFDKHIRYYEKDGTLVWAPQVTYRLGHLQLKEEKYQPCRGILCYYPQLESMQNVVLQSTINKKIREGVMENNPAETKDEDGNLLLEINENFTLNRSGDLLVIKYEASCSPVGAARGIERIRFDHFNIEDGTAYQLSDLFQKETPYIERITALINQQIVERNAAGDMMHHMEPFAGFTDEPAYELAQEELKVYLPYQEVGAPAEAGIVEFPIPYREVADLIDTEGDLWQALPQK